MNDNPEVSESEAYQRCLAVLSRREHSQSELRYKMQQHGVENNIIEAVLARLVADNYQSDERFAEVFCRSRVGRKYGAQKIRYELQQKGIDTALADEYLSQYTDELLYNAQTLIERKAPRGDVSALLNDFKLKNKVSRSLQNKGYDYDTIHLAFEALQEEK